MDPEQPGSPAGINKPDVNGGDVPHERRESISQRSEDSQTAAEFIRDQMQLEADAREAMPYSISNCTKPLGPLRQNVYACLTCNPPPSDLNDPYNAAGVCYACSVQCHGEHELVEIFQKRSFTCDCGTSRFAPDQPCTLRLNPETNAKGDVHSEPANSNNKYNQNFRNRFCSCSIDYKPHEQKGTMFQCLGLGTHETGGCGEDWYHPGCLVGLGPKWFEKSGVKNKQTIAALSGGLQPISEDAPPEESHTTPLTIGGNHRGGEDEMTTGDDDEDPPLPEGFPKEDDFEHLICYKCVGSNPWIKRYAGSAGFLPPVYLANPDSDLSSSHKKRKLDGEEESGLDIASQTKRVKSEAPEDEPDALTIVPTLPDAPIKIKEEETKDIIASPAVSCKLGSLPPSPGGQFSLFVKEGFRQQLCHCPECFPKLKPHPQLLEEEESYEPPLSDSASDNGSTHGSGSLYERGESALKNVDRVKAIEGVMAYNHLKDQLRPFFQQFADSGKAISAEDIKEYFAKLRGDADAIKDAGEAAKSDDHRREQGGY
ncbi:putative zinc finger in N-recognin-domain-containing protein [Xylariales sp. PMI_506]|nr:putative zinc finger in N-recognin-domain-containing protein [Xylariales sp. PMI_506]